MQVQVQSVNFDADQKLVQFIKLRIGKLSIFFDNIIDSEVYLKIDRANTIDNKIVEIKLNIPGRDLFAKKQCKSFEEATDETVEALRRQIKRHKGKHYVKG
ncbi:MAG: ribosome-associated translation inhibitor RaiA [Flavobacteriales bacterium]|nr:ribosome-associated translation inhibitor RaiA [Flavobacteriales bacterium]|tara:strand:+ start:333 stop:635 length:303 start_codon:yes stop_codon:yes gene_type:complete